MKKGHKLLTKTLVIVMALTIITGTIVSAKTINSKTENQKILRAYVSDGPDRPIQD